jgi:hypothetical protein
MKARSPCCCTCTLIRHRMCVDRSPYVRSTRSPKLVPAGLRGNAAREVSVSPSGSARRKVGAPICSMHAYTSVGLPPAHHARLPLCAPIWSGSRVAIRNRVDRLVRGSEPSVPRRDGRALGWVAAGAYGPLVRSPLERATRLMAWGGIGNSSLVRGGGGSQDGNGSTPSLSSHRDTRKEEKDKAKQGARVSPKKKAGRESTSRKERDGLDSCSCRIRAPARPSPSVSPTPSPVKGRNLTQPWLFLRRPAVEARTWRCREAALLGTTCVLSWLTAVRPASESDRQLRLRAKNPSIAKLFLFVLLRAPVVSAEGMNRITRIFWSTSFSLGYTEGGVVENGRWESQTL